jgi:hypothetical protein
VSSKIGCGAEEIFGSKREELKGDWRKLHNEKLHDLHPEPNIIRVTIPRWIRLMEHVARIE